MTKWILGSGSPRRKELLSGLGVRFEVRTSDVEEVYPSELPVSEVPAYLSKLKADALKEQLKENEVLICADTVVILENQLLGKPVDEQDAIAMLKQLSGKTHEVITGVYMTSKEKELESSTSTLVTFAELSDDLIKHYITHYQPFDKAGSYGVQEWLGYVGVTSMQGSYTNVMGFPTHVVYPMMQVFDLDLIR